MNFSHQFNFQDDSEVIRDTLRIEIASRHYLLKNEPRQVRNACAVAFIGGSSL